MMVSRRITEDSPFGVHDAVDADIAANLKAHGKPPRSCIDALVADCDRLLAEGKTTVHGFDVGSFRLRAVELSKMDHLWS